jgi:hypothetical protein
LDPVSNKVEFARMKYGRLLVLMFVATAVPQTAWAEQISGQLYPEKRTYLLGEPVFVVLDLVNAGSQPVWISVSCTWLDTRFDALTAPKPRQGASLFGCGVGGFAGSCGGSAREVLPGKHYKRRYLLDGPFRIDSPGVYPIRAWHKVDIYAGETGYQIVASQELVSEFELSFIEGSEKELASVYAPVLRDLESADPETNSLGRSAVLQDPPPFLEDLILAMAEDPQTAAASISGLQRLATVRAKAQLAELSAAHNPEYIRQMAVSALGELGDPAYCSLMLDIARESREYSRFIALRAAGYLCGEVALPLVTGLLGEADASSRFEAAYALGNTHSRDAVPTLISLLLDADANVRRAARDSLASLTHRYPKSNDGPARRTHDDWANWWVSNGASAAIYRIDECEKSEPRQ